MMNLNETKKILELEMDLSQTVRWKSLPGINGLVKLQIRRGKTDNLGIIIHITPLKSML